MKKIFSLVIAALFPVAAQASFQPWRLTRPYQYNLSDYQIGSEWGKKPVTLQSLRSHSPAYSRAAQATARLGSATSFYIGKFNGHHIMATNHHVMPREDLCGSYVAHFPIWGKSFRCEKFYGHWTEIDLAFYSIVVTSPADEQRLLQIGRNFNFRYQVHPGQELLTIGFGIFNNAHRQMMANEDSDCMVFTDQSDIRFLADPDRINPADYSAYSFATGCDVSHGDSGSAMVDRNSGDIVGIIWTTATNKPDRIRVSTYLTEARQQQHQDVWEWLSYAVPATAMKAFLEQLLASNRITDPDTAATIASIINN